MNQSQRRRARGATRELHTFCDSYVFKQEYNGCDRQVRAQGADKLSINSWWADMLETARNVLQDLDWVFSR